VSKFLQDVPTILSILLQLPISALPVPLATLWLEMFVSPMGIAKLSAQPPVIVVLANPAISLIGTLISCLQVKLPSQTIISISQTTVKLVP